MNHEYFCKKIKKIFFFTSISLFYKNEMESLTRAKNVDQLFLLAELDFELIEQIKN